MCAAGAVGPNYHFVFVFPALVCDLDMQQGSACLDYHPGPTVLSFSWTVSKVSLKVCIHVLVSHLMGRVWLYGFFLIILKRNNPFRVHLLHITKGAWQKRRLGSSWLDGWIMRKMYIADPQHSIKSARTRLDSP
jgi:hypothetical protein